MKFEFNANFSGRSSNLEKKQIQHPQLCARVACITFMFIEIINK